MIVYSYVTESGEPAMRTAKKTWEGGRSALHDGSGSDYWFIYNRRGLRGIVNSEVYAVAWVAGGDAELRRLDLAEELLR